MIDQQITILQLLRVIIQPASSHLSLRSRPQSTSFPTNSLWDASIISNQPMHSHILSEIAALLKDSKNINFSNKNQGQNLIQPWLAYPAFVLNFIVDFSDFWSIFQGLSEYLMSGDERNEVLQPIFNNNHQMSFEKRLRNLDIFKKVPADCSQPTDLGGVISILTVILISYFTIVQFMNYLNPEYVAEINQDKLFTRDEMTINLDITFPSFPCELISLDLEDVMISHHPNIGSVQKWRLDKNGQYLDKRNYQLLREQNPHKQMQDVRQAIKNEYGCRIQGSFTVKQVPGNFHVSCHGYFNHYMQMKMEGIISSLNTSHIIHKLYFGKEHHLNTIRNKHPESALHLLEGKRVTAEKGKSIHYHLDIVPTWYHQSAISNYYTYQYTYKQNQYEVDDQPAVVHFNYGIGGLIVQIKPRGEDLVVFLIHLCAILGGTYAIAQAIHNLLSNFTSKYEYELIK